MITETEAKGISLEEAIVKTSEFSFIQKLSLLILKFYPRIWEIQLLFGAVMWMSDALLVLRGDGSWLLLTGCRM